MPTVETSQAISLAIIEAPVYQPELPEPLYRKLSEPRKFPSESFGNIALGAINEIVSKTGCPVAIPGQSVLAAMALVSQSHVNVELPTGEIKPTSLFMLTVGESGERKSSSDKLAMAPIKYFEDEQRILYKEAYRLWKNKHKVWDKQYQSILSKVTDDDDQIIALNALGNEPEKPMRPILTCSEPTFSGMFKLLEDSLPSIAIFSDEGGEFLGGHGLKKENKQATITGLSNIWDGKEIRRVRSGDGTSILYGRRVSMHLMVQEVIAQSFLSDKLIIGQGLLSRFLVCYPTSTMGNRLWKNPSEQSSVDLKTYSERMLTILRMHLPTKEHTRNELEPRTVKLSGDARTLWINFHNHIEAQLKPNGELRPIAGIANKIIELSTRIATVIAFFENPHIEVLSAEDMAKGIELGQYYLSEALRLFDMGHVDKTLIDAEKLYDWLKNKWKEEYVSLPDVCNSGPNAIRDKVKAEPLFKILESQGYLIKADKPVVIGDKNRLNAWKIVK